MSYTRLNLLLIGSLALSGCFSAKTITTKHPKGAGRCNIQLNQLPVFLIQNSDEVDVYSIESRLLDLGFKVVDRKTLATILQEAHIQQSGLTKVDYVQIGKLSGAMLMVIPESTCRIRVADLAKGEIIGYGETYGPDCDYSSSIFEFIYSMIMSNEDAQWLNELPIFPRKNESRLNYLARLRVRYPEYSDVKDNELISRLIRKYPFIERMLAN